MNPVAMPFDKALARKIALEKQVSDLSKQLNALHDRLTKEGGFGPGPMGLTPDAVKNNPEYQRALAQYNKSNNEAKLFNTWFLKTFKKEYKAWRSKTSLGERMALYKENSNVKKIGELSSSKAVYDVTPPELAAKGDKLLLVRDAKNATATPKK